MGDHLVLVVDRLSSDSGLGTVNRAEPKADSVNEDVALESVSLSAGADLCESKFVQCRICHDEDEDTKMDTPCSCSGTLKFAHHNCVQRWCNEKGDTVCEICRQQYKPGYTAPRQLFHYTGISMNFGYFCSSCFGILLSSSAQCRNLTENHYLCWKHPSSDWGIEGLDLRNPYFLTWGDADDDHDLYSFHSPTSLICCRLIALLLPLVRTLGILLIAYVFFKSFIVIQRCRQERDTRLSGFSSDEETAPPRILMALPERPELHVPVN
ncbi:putative transcription factor C2H2 family [Arabidopsis thaliana]